MFMETISDEDIPRFNPPRDWKTVPVKILR
jgi:hypothetical protein